MKPRVMGLLCMLALCAWAVPAGASGYWDCWRYGWWAGTTDRRMQSHTKIECGGSFLLIGGTCGDKSHSQPNTWVDIAGGISQKCDDHSTSFWGPYSGEWNGCTYYFGGTTNQVSTGLKTIDSVNQSWDRWPNSWYGGHYYTTDMSFYNNHTANMRDPYGSVYDLDYCSFKQIMGTMYWGNFPVTSRLAAGNPADPYYGWARWDINGATGVSCSGIESSCANVVCSDLHVASSFECYYVEDWCDPYYDPWCYY